MSANVSQNYYVLGQAPLDAKIVFTNKQAFIDYTLNNEFFAFNFYKGMLVYLQEEEILCIWEFAYSPIYEENEKILPNNFIYPLGSVFNGLNYSEKAFNLIEIPLNKSNLGQWDLNTNDEKTLTIVVDESTISNVFVPEQITQLWPNAEKISFIDGNIQGIKFQGKQIEYFEEFSLLDWDQLTYEIWNPDAVYIQNAKMKIVMIGENIDYTQYQNRILANSFTEAKIIHEVVSAKNKNSIYFLNEENSFDILIVDKFFVVKKASDFFAKKDASNLSTYSASWRTALDLYSKHQIDLKNKEQDDRLTAIENDNTAQHDLINDLNSELDSEKDKNDAQDSRLINLEGINYIWSPTNRTLTLFDKEGNQLSQVSLVSLDDEGTSLKYNDTTLSLELYNEADELLTSIPVSSFIGSVGTQLHLSSNQLQLKDSQGNILSTVTLQIDSKTTDNVVATTSVGAINAGETVPAGTTIQGLTELLLNKTFYPTFVNPTFGLTNNAGLREVGSSFNVTLTFTFDKGKILGKLDNGIWNPTMMQDYRAGTATSYLLNGVSGSNNSASFNVTTILGNNNLSGSVTYGIGVQPKDSKNNNYDNPLPSGTSPIQNTSFEGIYPYFYYKSTSPITPEIMQSAIANGQATKVVASSTGTITIPFAANGEYIAVAYPASSTTKTIWYVNALDNGAIGVSGGVLGSETILPCNSPTNLWSNVNFKIHVSAGLITQPNPIQLKNS